MTCLLGLVLAGCDLGRRRVLVWHDWPAPEAAILIDLLNGYSELDPDLRLIIEYIPADEIESRFADEVQSGFGPDVLIGVDADRLSDLVSADAVHPVTPAQSASHRFDQLETRAMEAMVINGEQQGIPFAGSTDVLYFRDGISPVLELQILDRAIGFAGQSTHRLHSTLWARNIRTYPMEHLNVAKISFVNYRGEPDLVRQER